MKELQLLISTILIINASLAAQDKLVDSIFNVANAAYSTQDYYGAIEEYEKIIDLGFESAEVFYNVGNSYFKLKEYPKAVLNFERAELLNPRDPDIKFNLEKSYAYTIDKIEVIPEFFLITWMRKIISSSTSNIWAIIAILAFVLVLVLFLVYFINPSRRVKVLSFTLGGFMMFISIISLIFAFNTKRYIENSDRAIIMESTVTVKGAPDINAVNVFIVHEGTKVILVRSIGEWHEVQLSDGKQGWLQESDIEKI